ncbi:MAG TPA: hypothetical protein PKC30_03975 [Saprospiraceae bacterium]|nr:hypothetical protein [Saprospiraceae bacterium]
MHLITRMKWKPVFFLFSLIVWSTSCGSTLQEITLRYDGSGVIYNQYDFTEMLGMIKMMKSAMEGEESTPGFSENIMEVLLKENPIDTSFTMGQALPDSLRHRIDHPELLDKMSIRVQMSGENNQTLLGITISFDHQEEIIKIFEELLKTEDEEEKAAIDLKEIRSGFGRFTVHADQGMVFFEESEFKVQGMEASELEFENMQEEDKEMMELFFGEQKNITVIHLPGRIIEYDHPLGILSEDGTTLTIEESMLNLIRSKRSPAFTIRYETK